VAALVDLVEVDEVGIGLLVQLRGAGYCSLGKTETVTGMETPFALKKPPLYSQ
jgi:hypothetical protein